MATRSKMKSQYRKENADRRPHATAKHIRISSRKVKIVIDLIRGKSVEDAEAILMYTPKAASEPTLKVLRSAIANAVNNLDMDKETLYVAECFANQGPTLRRYAPLPRQRIPHPQAHQPYHHHPGREEIRRTYNGTES